MPKLMEWCDEAAVLHWQQESAAEPTWAEAHRRLLAEGRVSKVLHPSPKHATRDYPPPRTREG